jgi:hypothetical protein
MIAEETAKLVAETNKLNAEAEKLRAERAYLARPPWQRTESIGLFGSILVATVGFAGVLWTQHINHKLEELQTQIDSTKEQRSRLEESVKSLPSETEQLRKDRDQLRSGSALLEFNLAELSDKAIAESQNLERQRSEEADTRAAISALQAQKERLEEDAKFFKIDNAIRGLKSARYLGEIGPLIHSAPEADRTRLADSVLERAKLANLSPEEHFNLLRGLYDGTLDDRFRSELIHLGEHFLLRNPYASISEEEHRAFRQAILDLFVGESRDYKDCELLVHSLWIGVLSRGSELSKQSLDDLDGFLLINECSNLADPAAYFLTLAEVQRRLVSSTDFAEIDKLASIIGIHAPQGLLLTWYYGSEINGWKHRQSVIEMVDSIPETLAGAPMGPEEMKEVIPSLPRGWGSGPLPEDWKTGHRRIIAFWVPINYDPEIHDPATHSFSYSYNRGSGVTVKESLLASSDEHK